MHRFFGADEPPLRRFYYSVSEMSIWCIRSATPGSTAGCNEVDLYLSTVRNPRTEDPLLSKR